MAEDEKTVLIKVELDTGQLKKNAIEAEKALEKLTPALKQLKTENKQNTLEYAKAKAEIKTHTKVVNDSAKALVNNSQIQKKNNGSINDMRKQLAAATVSYNNLSKAERTNSKVGKKLKTDIKGLSDELKGQEEAIGDNRRSVGNYSEGLQGMGGAAGSAAGGVARLSASMKAMLANPLVLVIATLVGLFMALKKAFTGTEEGQNKLAKATAVVSALFSKFIDLLEPLATFLVDVFVAAIEAVGGALEWLGKIQSDFVRWLGFDALADAMDGAVQGSKDFIAMTEKIADVRAKADTKERALIVERAKIETKIAQLREKAAAKENFSAAERIEFLKEAGKLTDEVFAKETIIANARFQALKVENQMTNSTKEVKLEQAEAEASLIRLEESRAKAQKKIIAEQVTAEREAATERAKIASKRQAAFKKAADERLKIEKQINDLAFDNLELSIENEEAAIIEKYRFLAAQAETGSDEMIQIQKNLSKELDAVNVKNRDLELSKLKAEHDTAINAAKGNKKLIELLEENHTLEKEKINSDYVTKKAITDEKILSDEEKLAADRIALEKKTAAEKEAIDEETAEREKALALQKKAQDKSLALSAVNSAQQLSDSLFQIAANQIQKELNLNKEQHDENSQALTNELNAGLITQAEFDAQSSALNEAAAAQESKLKKEQFEKNKAAQLVNAAISTAVGVTQALSAPPPVGFIMAGIAAAIGAAQIGIIASQPTPTFADGGQAPLKSGTFGGNLHSGGGTKGSFSDGTQVEVERDEAFFILNRKASSQISALSSHNQKHGGASLMRDGGVMKFAGGGSFATSISRPIEDSFSQNDIMLKAIQSLPSPTVFVDDIDSGQANKVRVQQNGTF